ncbi:MAG TPA: cytochrome b N-terminal domain-containing protein [Bryobacteraceae bacterium]|nr:cytochrome b N-terminal domain-containing protein [Bryobacteraceae bacterium]
MIRHLRSCGDWVENRTGIAGAIRHFLYEDIPASSGWHQVLGSVALFLFLVQAFTGILLAFNYAPTPGDSYDSLRYILTEVTGGRLIRGLHHWGASMIIVVVGLHLAQVFLYGAYKKPRETTWLVGVVLLLLTLAFGLTGYLLPWDNRAYWGTVVTTQIASNAPLGSYLLRFLGGQGSIGVVTFARFYALHVLLLPPATALLIAGHVYLVRKHGVAPAPGDELVPKKKFHPEQVFKDTVAIFIAFSILFIMAVVVHVPLEKMADPTDTAYIPRPEWYFLFLFQTLKFFNGPLEVVGSVVLPGLAVLALVLVPFIDRGQMVRLTRRTFAFGLVILAAIGWTGLTVAAVVTTPKEARTVAVDYSEPTEWLQLSPDDLAAVGYFRQANCARCHSTGQGGATAGPDLSHISARKDVAWMLSHFKQEAGSAAQLTDAQWNSLAAFLGKLNPDSATAFQYAPEFAVQGAAVYQTNHCGACHMVNGVGVTVGPPLNGLSRRRARDWTEQHFADPQKLSPGSIMPPYKLSPTDLDHLTSYLFVLPDAQ